MTPYIKIDMGPSGRPYLYIHFKHSRQLVKQKYANYLRAVNKNEYKWEDIKKKKDKNFYANVAIGKKNRKLLKNCHTKEGYAVYLQTPYWKDFRNRAIKYYGEKCQNCKTAKNLRVHHLNYNCLFREKFSDVKVLCDICHGEHHGHEVEGDVDREFQRIASSF